MNRADYNVGNLESEIKVQFEQAVSALNQTTTALDSVTSELKDVIYQLNTLKSNTGLQDTAKQAENLKKNLSGTDKLLNFNNTLKSTIKLGAIYGILRKGYDVVKDITMSNVDMIEATNLFEVSMGKVVDEYGNLDEAQSQYYTNAMAFQDKMNEKFGTNKKMLMEYQAKFNSLYANQGVDKKTSEWLSEQLSKAGYDIASLRNQEVSTVMDKLYSGITGQTKSIRDLGVDIGEGSITATLQRLGIDRTVNQLSYAEKEIARYITIVEQAKNAQGDFARTFERPAQQIKVFQAQLVELKQVAGSFFTGLFGQIMPYVNGIIMAIKEVLKALGAVFGFEIDTGDSSLGAVDDTIGDIETGLGRATAKAKEFKKQLMGFDEINNITPPSESGGGSGGGAIAGVDSALLNALKEWDNQMDSISGKAQEIRDKILDWLGVTDGSYENLNKIFEIAKLIGTAIGGWKLSSTITKIFEKLGKLNKTQAFEIAFGLTLTLTGITAQYSGTQKLLDGDWDIFNLLETFGGMATGASGIATLLKSLKIGKLDMTNAPFKNRLQMAFGIMIALQGVQVAVDGVIKDDVIKQITGALETGLGGLISGWSVGDFKYGLKVGLFFTLATSVTELTADTAKWASEYRDRYVEIMKKESGDLNWWQEIQASWAGAGEGFGQFLADITSGFAGIFGSEVSSSRDNIKAFKTEVNELIGSYKKLQEEKEKNLENIDLEIGVSQKLADELVDLVDENGHVKEGYEARVDFIMKELNKSFDLELSRDGEIIKKNGEVIDNNNDLRDSINRVIQKRKQELKLEAYGEIYKEQLKVQIKLEKEREKASQKRSEALEEYLKKSEEFKNKNPFDLDYSKSIAELWTLYNNYEQADASLRDLNEANKECAQDIEETNRQLTASMIETTGELSSGLIEQGGLYEEQIQQMAKDSENQWTENFNKLDESQKQLMLSLSTTVEENAPVVISKWRELSQGSYDEFKQYMDKTDEKGLATILGILTNTEGLTPNITQAWIDLANQSSTAFNEGIKDLPDDAKGKILATVIAVNDMDEQTKETYRNLSINAKAEFNKAMASLDDDARGKVLASIMAVDGLTKENEETYRNLSSKGKLAFNNAMATMDDDARSKVLASIIAVEGLTEENRKAYENLSDKAKGAFVQAMGNMDEEARNKVNSAVHAVRGQAQMMYDAGYYTSEAGRNGANDGSNSQGGSVQIGNWFVQGLVNALTGGRSSVWWAGYNLVKQALFGGNQAQRTGSPAKESIKMGNYFTEGYIVGLKKKQEEIKKVSSNLVETALGEFNQLNQGIKIDPKDFEVNANQYVNYSAIKGQILAQSQVAMNENIVDRIAEAVTESMRNAEVNVNLNAKIQKGIMLETVQEEAREYTMQTGEPAFDY